MGRDIDQEVENVLMTDEPDQFSHFPRRENFLVSEIEPVGPDLLKGADHAVGMAQQMKVIGALKIQFSSPENIHIQGIKGGFIHQEAISQGLLQEAVELPGRQALG